MPWAQLWFVWGFFALNVLSPGPNVFNTIGIALGSGRRAALGAAVGVGPGVALWGVAAVLGISALFAVFPAAQTLLTAAGGLLLLVFGSRYLRRALARGPDRVRARDGISPGRAFMATLAVLATNPKALTTWLLILSLFPAGQTPPMARVVLVAGMACIATLIHIGYALLFSTRAAAAVYGRAAPVIDAAVGVFFLSIGLRLLAGLAGLV
jgi:threonine/homoserine/homoserine lactone efflux protein